MRETLRTVVAILMVAGSLISGAIPASNLPRGAQEEPTRTAAPQQNLEQYTSSTILRLDYGTEVHRVGRTIERYEELPIGPQSFALAGDDIIVVDTINGRAKRFDLNGTLVSDFAVGRATDIIATSADEFLVADPTGHRLVRLTPAGAEDVAVSEPVESFGLGGDFPRNLRLNEPVVLPAGKDLPSKAGRRDIRIVGDYEGVIVDRNNGSEIRVTTSERLGSINPLGADDAGNIYVVIEELLTGFGIDVRRTVRKFSPSGALRAIIEIPIDNNVFPERDLLVDGDGAVYHMQPLRELLIINKWLSK